MKKVFIHMPVVEIGINAAEIEIRNGEDKKVGSLTINKKWITFKKANCTIAKRIPLEKLPEVFDKLGK